MVVAHTSNFQQAASQQYSPQQYQSQQDPSTHQVPPPYAEMPQQQYPVSHDKAKLVTNEVVWEADSDYDKHICKFFIHFFRFKVFTFFLQKSSVYKYFYINPFLVNVLIWYPLKTSENKEYKMWKFARNRLNLFCNSLITEVPIV